MKQTLRFADDIVLLTYAKKEVGEVLNYNDDIFPRNNIRLIKIKLR